MRLSGRPIRRTLISSAVLLAAVVLGWTAPAFCASWNQPLHEKKHDAKRQVEALEEQWRQAQLAGDVAAMDKLLSDDYIGISMTGQVNTKTQQLDRMRMHKIALTKLDLGESGEVDRLDRDCHLPGRGGGDQRWGSGEGHVPIYAGLSAPAVGGMEDYQLRGDAGPGAEESSGSTKYQSRRSTKSDRECPATSRTILELRLS